MEIHLVCSKNMDIVYQIPVLILHVLKADIPQNSRIVDEDIDAAEGFDGCVDDLVSKLNTVIVGNSLSAFGLDFVHYEIGSLCSHQHLHKQCGNG